MDHMLCNKSFPAVDVARKPHLFTQSALQARLDGLRLIKGLLFREASDKTCAAGYNDGKCIRKK